MKTNQKDTLPKLLKDLSNLRKKAKNKSLERGAEGICTQVGIAALDIVWTKELLESWPHFSGNIHYPIPSTTKGVSPIKHYFRYELWIGEQRKLRISLLDHLIKAVKIEIEKEKGMRASTPNPT